MKTSTAILLLALVTGCKMNTPTEVTEKSSSSFFVGTYTDGQSQGIYKYQLNSDGTMAPVGLAAKTENPSFLALSADKKYLVAVNEIADAEGKGSVDSYSLNGDSLLFLSRSSSGGAHPCFVAVNASGQVLVANYTGGNVGLLQLGNNGVLSNLLDLQQHTGKGTTSRQEAPHAHSAWFAPNGGVIAVDLGTNELWFSQVDTVTQKFISSEPQKLAMAEGAGPRHLYFHPNKQWTYVLNELNNTIALVKKNEKGQYETMDTIATLPNDFKEFSKAADIHTTRDGKFVYASNRGHNSIAIFGVNNDDGTLTFIAHEPTRGEEPRNFSLSPDENFLLVANQNSNNIIAFKRNQSTGLLSYVSEIEAFKPVCILFE